jgi:hypothetical protein
LTWIFLTEAEAEGCVATTAGEADETIGCILSIRFLIMSCATSGETPENHQAK